MKAIKATYNGQQFQPDEPINLPANSKAIILVMNLAEETWYGLASHSLARAYSNDEPEYSLNQLKELNSDYEGG